MKRILTSIVGYLVVGTAHAELSTIEFDYYAPTTLITDQYAEQGATFSLEGTGAPAGVTQPWVIPSNPFGTGGNIIFPGDYSTSNYTYDVRISFSGLADFFSIYALDAEESFTISAYLGSTLVGTATVTDLGYLGPVETYGVSGPVKLAQFGEIGGALLFDSVLIDLPNGLTQNEGGPEIWDNLSVNIVDSTNVLPVSIEGNRSEGETCKNPKRITIFGSSDVDVTQIDPKSLYFGEDAAVAGASKRPVRCLADYANTDEFLDLICTFVRGTATAKLSGEMVDGNRIEGSVEVCLSE